MALFLFEHKLLAFDLKNVQCSQQQEVYVEQRHMAKLILQVKCELIKQTSQGVDRIYQMVFVLK